jgi:hypothetical protein
MTDFLKEICKNCGLTFGAHCGGAYYSRHYKMNIPSSYCPGHEGRMDWDKGPGTVFVSTGLFKDVAYNTAAKGVVDNDVLNPV